MQTHVQAPASTTTEQAKQQQRQPEYETDSTQLLRAPQFEDGRPEVTAQLRQQSLMANSPRTTQFKVMQAMMASSPRVSQLQATQAMMAASPRVQQLKTTQAFMAAGTLANQNHQAPAASITQRMEDEEPLQAKIDEPVQREQAEASATDPTPQDSPPSETSKPNNTGLPDQLKTGIENLSGMSMDHVKVHYNSDKPAQLQAHAYAQGSEIHVAPGQEQHLPHEAWHVVQQAQGRVRPTVQMKGGVSVNDDMGLEQEADVMGVRAISDTKEVSLPLQTIAAPAPVSQCVVQRLITIDHIDYNPQTQQYRDGFINQVNFYQTVRNAMTGPYWAIYANHWINVRNSLAAHFNAGDVDAMTATISQAIIAQYGGARPVIAGARVNALEAIVRAALIANIQPDHQVNMTQGEATAFDQLAATVGATVSRAKGTPNTVQYANLPGGVQNEVAARLTEVRTERGLWSVVALTPQLLLRGAFAADVTGRQRAIRYQGNHTNLAGWLPTVAAPNDVVSATALEIYNRGSSKLRGILDQADPMGILNNNGLAHARRTEFERLCRQQATQLNDDLVVQSAMAALCGGVSGYIEFSMAGDISRLMYDPVNQQVYITAHYKWREGKSPFFEVLGFPAV